MAKLLKAIRYRSLDEAKRIVSEYAPDEVVERLFDDSGDDSGQEPQGLLAAIVEDMLSEEYFYPLFEAKKGVLVQVERVDYSGFGPPAEEPDYMGFVSSQTAYILEGCRLPVHIRSCPQGARDIHHLEALVLDRQHPLNRDDLAQRLGLAPDWDFADLFDLISARQISASDIDRLIHRGIQ